MNSRFQYTSEEDTKYCLCRLLIKWNGNPKNETKVHRNVYISSYLYLEKFLYLQLGFSQERVNVTWSLAKTPDVTRNEMVNVRVRSREQLMFVPLIFLQLIFDCRRSFFLCNGCLRFNISLSVNLHRTVICFFATISTQSLLINAIQVIFKTCLPSFGVKKF